MHELLRKGTRIQLYPIRGHPATANFIYDDYTASKKKEDPIDFQLPESEEHRLDEGVKLSIGKYCRPDVSNFPTVDSIYAEGVDPSSTLTMFQITRNKKEHDVNPEGLDRIDKLDLGLVKNVRKQLVVITPEDIQPKIKVPMTLFKVGGDGTDGGQKANRGRKTNRGRRTTRGGKARRGGKVKGVQKASGGVTDNGQGGYDEPFPVLHYPVKREELFEPSKAV